MTRTAPLARMKSASEKCERRGNSGGPDLFGRGSQVEETGLSLQITGGTSRVSDVRTVGLHLAGLGELLVDASILLSCLPAFLSLHRVASTPVLR